MSCGVVGLGGGSPNVLAPTNATSLAQGAFTGVVTGKTVAGNAIVYSVNGAPGSYILRLQSLTAPSEAGIQAVVSSTSGIAQTVVLSAFSGNYNYTFSAANNLIFVGGQVTIHSTANNQDYGQALLQ